MWTTGPRCGPQDQEGMWQTCMWTTGLKWATGPRRHVTDLDVDHRTNTWQQNTHICGTHQQGCYIPTLTKTSLVDHFIRTGGPLYINTLNKTRSCKPPHNSDMWTATKQHWTRPGHVDHLTTGTCNVDCNIQSLNKTWTCGLPYKDMWTAISQLKKTPNRHKPQDKYMYTNMACHTHMSVDNYIIWYTPTGHTEMLMWTTRPLHPSIYPHIIKMYWWFDKTHHHNILYF